MDVSMNWSRVSGGGTHTENRQVPEKYPQPSDIINEFGTLWTYLDEAEQQQVVSMVVGMTATQQKLAQLRQEAERRFISERNAATIRFLDELLAESDPDVIKDQQETLALLQESLKPDAE